MLLFTRERLSEMLDFQSRKQALLDLQEEGIEVEINRRRFEEFYNYYYQGGRYTLDSIFKNFEFLWVSKPFMDGIKVTEWRHETARLECSDFNGTFGEKFLSVAGDMLDECLKSYLREDNEYLQSEYLDRWLVDMMIYAECRGIALESVGRMALTTMRIPFWRYKFKKRMKAEMSSLLPEAVRAYRCLDGLEVDWGYTLKVLNDTYNNGILWRDPLPNFVKELAQRSSAMNLVGDKAISIV